MKRTKKIIILFAVFVIVLISYMIITKITMDKDNNNDDKSVSVKEINANSISEISWLKDGKDIALKSTDGVWSYKADSNFPLDQSYPSAMIDAVSNLKGSKIIDNAVELSQYGLDNPSFTINITTKDGTKIIYLIGNMNEITSKYYLMTEGDPAVYMVGKSLITAFDHKLNDLIDMEEIPDVSDVQSLNINTKNDTTELIYSDKDNNTSNVDKWFINNNGLKTADKTKVEKLFNTISNLKWSSCVEYNASKEKLEQYGLDDPNAVVKISYYQKTENSKKTDDENSKNEKSSSIFTLLIGRSSQDNCYAKIDGSNMIYLIDKNILDNSLDADYSTLRSFKVCDMNWDAVDSIDVNIEGKPSTLKIIRTDGKTTYKIDDEDCNNENANKFVNFIKNMKAESEADNAVIKGSKIDINFHGSSDNFGDIKLSFAQYNSTNYLVSFNGETGLLVKTDDINSLIDTFKAIKEK